MAPAVPDSSVRRNAYWRAVLRRTVLLLAIWFTAGPLLGILLADRLNAVSLAGVPFGFWVAQQGAIYVFVVLIFAYAWMAGRADRGEDVGQPGGDGDPSPGSGR